MQRHSRSLVYLYDVINTVILGLFVQDILAENRTAVCFLNNFPNYFSTDSFLRLFNKLLTGQIRGKSKIIWLRLNYLDKTDIKKLRLFSLKIQLQLLMVVSPNMTIAEILSSSVGFFYIRSFNVVQKYVSFFPSRDRMEIIE